MMTKADLVARIATTAELTKRQAEQAVDTFVSSVQDVLKTGDRVTLVGFGTFAVIARQSRKGRNPRTGQELSIPARQSREGVASGRSGRRSGGWCSGPSGQSHHCPVAGPASVRSTPVGPDTMAQIGAVRADEASSRCLPFGMMAEITNLWPRNLTAERRWRSHVWMGTIHR